MRFSETCAAAASSGGRSTGSRAGAPWRIPPWRPSPRRPSLNGWLLIAWRQWIRSLVDLIVELHRPCGPVPQRCGGIVGWEGMDLSASEIRVLGCLLEKQRTTPDHYPLSLNSLRLACNQATNREPAVDYDDAVIRDALHRLERRGYVRLAGA